MSETKFTPGPWRTEFTDDDGIENHVVVGPGKDEWVADCGCGGNAEACAHLIAAAPEMYDMLLMALGQLCYLQRESERMQSTADHIKSIELTLKKARGEQ